MSALINLRHMPVIQRCVWNHINKVSRTISTSKKNSDTAGAGAACQPKCEPTQDWVSYGYSYTSKEEDTNAHNASFFFSITLCMVLGGVCWAYAPDLQRRNWVQREAFLELRRRELEGLPPIDPNFIPKKEIKLPKEEELCDFELII